MHGFESCPMNSTRLHLRCQGHRSVIRDNLVAVQSKRASSHGPSVVETSCYIRVRHADRCVRTSNKPEIDGQREAGFFGEESGRPIHAGLHVQKPVTGW